VVYVRDSGITAADVARARSDQAAYQSTVPGLESRVSPPIPSADGRALAVAMPILTPDNVDLGPPMKAITKVAQPGGAVPAQTCREAASAPPTGTHAARAALYLGYLDHVVDLWRIAAGYGVERADASPVLRSTVELPVFLTVAGGKGAYAGLVRVTPSVRFGGPVGDRATVWAVSIALLGQRSLFSEEYDRL